MRRLRFKALLALLPILPLLADGLLCAADKTAIQVVPGPREISAQEKALAPDPAKGSQHGIILIDETMRDESQGTESNVYRHVRAKIFSNEARNLGDLEFTSESELGTSLLKKLWGVTLLPDGSILEVTQNDLKEQELARTAGSRIAVKKLSLRGIVPGCVIDYGYYLQERGYYGWMRADIQGKAPIQEYRYRWLPFLGMTSSYHLSHTEGLPITFTRDQKSVLVSARDLPAVPDEPYMPPDKESHASAEFYYRSASNKPEDFWNLEAKRLVRRAQAFAKEKAIAEAVARVKLPEGAGPMAKVKAAYDWIGANIKNTTLRTSEEAETDDKDDGSNPGARTAADVLAAGGGSARELDFLFYGMSRALGADAAIVLATDRTDHYFDPNLLSTRQFDWTLVGVKAPGEPEDKRIFADVGTGLPFGEVPWWITGSRVFQAGPDGYSLALLNPSDPRKNVLETDVKIAFNMDEGTATCSWTSEGSGQQGLSERWRLRSMSAEERSKALEADCGASGDFEVSRSESSTLSDLNEKYRLSCEGTLQSTNLTPKLGSYSFSITGPWVRWNPQFTEATRTQVIIFQYPRIDVVKLDVKSPAGFISTPVAAPPPIESPFGRYMLNIQATPEGYHVERLYAMVALVIPPKDYDVLRHFLAEVARVDGTRLEFRRAGAP
jgi:hypothetical protein